MHDVCERMKWLSWGRRKKKIVPLKGWKVRIGFWVNDGHVLNDLMVGINEGESLCEWGYGYKNGTGKGILAEAAADLN